MGYYDDIEDLLTNSPRYEVSILNGAGFGKYDNPISTPSTEVTRSLSLTVKVSAMLNQKWILSFSTENYEKVIYFNDVVVTYKCVK
jgi:hypothetical protein